MSDLSKGAALSGAAAEGFERAVDAAALEFKSGNPAAVASVEEMLAKMRGELGQQFGTFVALRDGASRRTGDDQPEAEAKQARSDLKAAVEGLSVIVRTLEKVDQLERQLARDRAELEAAPEGRDAHETLLAEVSALIEARVEERLAARVEERLRALAAEPATHAGAPPRADAGADDPAQDRAPEGPQDAVSALQGPAQHVAAA